MLFFRGCAVAADTRRDRANIYGKHVWFTRDELLRALGRNGLALFEFTAYEAAQRPPPGKCTLPDTEPVFVGFNTLDFDIGDGVAAVRDRVREACLRAVDGARPVGELWDAEPLLGDLVRRALRACALVRERLEGARTHVYLGARGVHVYIVHPATWVVLPWRPDKAFLQTLFHAVTRNAFRDAELEVDWRGFDKDHGLRPETLQHPTLRAFPLYVPEGASLDDARELRYARALSPADHAARVAVIADVIGALDASDAAPRRLKRRAVDVPAPARALDVCADTTASAPATFAEIADGVRVERRVPWARVGATLDAASLAAQNGFATSLSGVARDTGARAFAVDADGVDVLARTRSNAEHSVLGALVDAVRTQLRAYVAIGAAEDLGVHVDSRDSTHYHVFFSRVLVRTGLGLARLARAVLDATYADDRDTWARLFDESVYHSASLSLLFSAKTRGGAARRYVGRVAEGGARRVCALVALDEGACVADAVRACCLHPLLADDAYVCPAVSEAAAVLPGEARAAPGVPRRGAVRGAPTSGSLTGTEAQTVDVVCKWAARKHGWDLDAREGRVETPSGQWTVRSREYWVHVAGGQGNPCPYKGGAHRSNNATLRIDLVTGALLYVCLDHECRAAMDRAPPRWEYVPLGALRRRVDGS